MPVWKKLVIFESFLQLENEMGENGNKKRVQKVT